MKSAAVNRIPRIVVVDSDPRARSYVRSVLDEGDARVVGEAADIRTGMRFIRGLQPDIVLIELPENATETMEAVKKIREEQPEAGIILSRHNPSPQLILSAMRAGAQEFVDRPVDGPELEKAVQHVRRQMVRTGASGPERGKIVSVFSSKGGAGGTSVAVNLAVALCEREDARTVVVDMNLQMGDLALMLNRPPRYSLTDALVDGRVDESRLRSVITDHDSGVDVLTIAASPELGEELTPHHIVDVLGTLATLYHCVVVDVGRTLDDRTVEALELSDQILLLSTLDVPSVRNASRYLNIFDRLGIDRDCVRLVLNRFHKKTRLNVKDVEAALGMDAFWTIPNDYEPVSDGIDHGSPAVIKSKRSRVARNFRQLAGALLQAGEAAAAEPTEKEQPAAPVEPDPVAPAPEVPQEAVGQMARKNMRPAAPNRRRAAPSAGVSVNVDLPGF